MKRLNSMNVLFLLKAFSVCVGMERVTLPCVFLQMFCSVETTTGHVFDPSLVSAAVSSAAEQAELSEATFSLLCFTCRPVSGQRVEEVKPPPTSAKQETQTPTCHFMQFYMFLRLHSHTITITTGHTFILFPCLLTSCFSRPCTAVRPHAAISQPLHPFEF